MAWRLSEDPGLVKVCMGLSYVQKHPFDFSLWNLSVHNPPYPA
jgi:hypothetical protein